MEKHLVYCLFYILWFQSKFTVNSQTSDICVFGTDYSCFYQCKCQFFNCSIQQDPNCKICQDLTGLCIKDNACKYDTVINDIYITRYWTGAACQKGNIAASKLYSVSGSFLNLDPAVGGATDGSLTWYVAFFITSLKHTATVYLEGTHQIEFIDIFLQSEDLSLADLADFLTTKLIMENGSFSECAYVQYPSNDYRLKTTLVGKERMHFRCNSPSVGHELEVVMLGTGFSFYEVHVYEIVIIGYKFAEVSAQNCLQIEGDEEISWCSKCNNTLPPECQQECPQSLTGINCKDVIKTTLDTFTTESYETSTVHLSSTTLKDLTISSTTNVIETDPPDSGTSGVIFIAIGIVVGLLLCICCTLVVVLVFYKYRKKKYITGVNLEREPKIEQTYDDEEETYDELDYVVTMDNANGNGTDKVTAPTVGFRKSSTLNEYSVITGLENPRKSFNNEYLSTKTAADLETVTNDCDDRKGVDHSSDKAVPLRDSYLTPRDVENENNREGEINPVTEPTEANATEETSTGEYNRKDISDTYLTQQLSQEFGNLGSLQGPFPDVAVKEVHNTLIPQTKEPSNGRDKECVVVRENLRETHKYTDNMEDEPYLISQPKISSRNVDKEEGAVVREKLEETNRYKDEVEDTDDPYLRPVFKDSKVEHVPVMNSHDVAKNMYASLEKYSAGEIDDLGKEDEDKNCVRSSKSTFKLDIEKNEFD